MSMAGFDPGHVISGAAAVTAAIIGVLGGWYTKAIQHRKRPEHALIDQLQEDLGDLRTEMRATRAEHQKQISALQTDAAQTKRRERIRDDYINLLRQDIMDRRPPPPREWPPELTAHYQA